MNTILQKIINKEITTHELCAGLFLHYYTEDPTISQMATRWGVPASEIHQIIYKIARAKNEDKALTLFKSILYLLESGIYTNISQIQTKLNQI